MQTHRTFKHSFLAIAVTTLLSSCATNPVTGKNELMLIPEATELQLGEENYQPSRQMQGGDYIADPKVAAYIQEIGRKLAVVSDRKLPYEFNVVNDSQINAWMLPGGKMGINRGLLLKMDNEAELAAVMGHEMTHAAAKHGAKHIQQALLLQGAVLVASVAIGSSTEDKGTQTAGIIGAQVVSALLQSKFSRDDEREADHYGMVYMSRAGYDPKAAVTVQEMLLRESKGSPDNMLTQLLADHPPSAERVAANRAFTKKLPKGGLLGRQAYHRRLAHLFKVAPAYAAYDKGQKALKAHQYSKALQLADKAIAIEPKEALFHILKGSALEGKHKKNAAINQYQKAAALNPGYFAPHLKLGLLLDSVGRRKQAQQSLKKSVKLLKTAPALFILGRYAKDRGNLAQAKKYFAQAAQDGGSAGKAAYADLLRVDLPVNSSSYVTASMVRNSSGQLDFLVKNNTPFPIGKIILEIREGRNSKRIPLRGVVDGNTTDTYPTGVAVTQQDINNASVEAVSARLQE
ncbi:MAG TPA: peptidase M48 [Gammaproteobacteria bacterium]|nr:peptidase M48 [Gammaproteobacteria bacterium]